MRIITYAGQSMVTGDDIAVALLKYAEALALSQRSATVEVPVLLPNGSLDRAIILIGPASEMTAVHQPYDGADITDEALVAHLHTQTSLLSTPLAIVEDSPIILDVPNDL